MFIIRKYPTYFYRGAISFGFYNAALFRAQFSLFEILKAENFNVKEVSSWEES